jgi:hypothetical protein
MTNDAAAPALAQKDPEVAKAADAVAKGLLAPKAKGTSVLLPLNGDDFALILSVMERANYKGTEVPRAARVMDAIASMLAPAAPAKA